MGCDEPFNDHAGPVRTVRHTTPAFPARHHEQRMCDRHIDMHRAADCVIEEIAEEATTDA